MYLEPVFDYFKKQEKTVWVVFVFPVFGYPCTQTRLMEELRKRGCAVFSVMAGTRGAGKGVGRCLAINATN